MFQPNTLFVIGAGASAEVGLPIGSDLAQQISTLLTFKLEFGRLVEGDQEFFEKITKCLSRDKAAQYLKAAAQIAEGVYPVKSIDRYIDMHQHNEPVIACSKAAIVYSILHAERQSLLYVDPQARGKLNLSMLEKTWFAEFGRMLVKNVKLPDVESLFENITIICFNYDRCIEEFLAHYLSAVFAIELLESRNLVEKLRILRPYGGIGPLPSQNAANSIAFGEDQLGSNIFTLSCNIKTFSEQVEDGNLLNEINSATKEAETIVFLGFGFLQPNMELISKSVKGSNAKRIYATVLESMSNRELVKEDIRAYLKPLDKDVEIIADDKKCQPFLVEYYRSITTGRRYNNSLRVLSF